MREGGHRSKPWFLRPWFLLAGAVVFVCVAVGFYLALTAYSTASLEFQLRDAVSGAWVWDSTVAIQGRVNRGYYQISYTFTNLKPGAAVLDVSAPSYVTQSIAVTLSRGANRLREPIRLVGYEIPGLQEFLLFESSSAPDTLGLQLRPRGKDGQAIANHPALDLKVAARISAQMRGHGYAQTDDESGSTRGAQLYWGPLSWVWDPLPETLFRYHASVPYRDVASSPAPYWVVDCVLLVPDPRRITTEELDAVFEKVLAARDPNQVSEVLAPYAGRVRPFVTTTWGVKAGG